MPPVYSQVVPNAVASELIGGLMVESVVMKAGRVIRVPSGVDYLPVVSAFPSAAFTSPAYGGRKHAGDFDIDNRPITLEEIAVALAVPDAFVEDVTFPLWDSLKPMMTTAIAVVLDNAALFGTGAPASYPAGGVEAKAGAPVSGADAAEALSGAMSAVEARGVLPDGIVMGTAGLGGIRDAQGAVGVAPINADAARTAYGLPLYPSLVWDATSSDAFVGNWKALVIAIRNDIRYAKSTDGVLVDGAGAVTVSAFQDNQTLFKCWLRVGVAIVDLVGPSGLGGSAFAAADWTTVVGATARGDTSGGTKAKAS